MKKYWKPCIEDCPECNGEMEIETTAENKGECYDGDAIRCNNCGFNSGITVNEDGTFYIQ